MLYLIWTSCQVNRSNFVHLIKQTNLWIRINIRTREPILSMDGYTLEQKENLCKSRETVSPFFSHQISWHKRRISHTHLILLVYCFIFTYFYFWNTCDRKHDSLYFQKVVQELFDLFSIGSVNKVNASLIIVIVK